MCDSLFFFMKLEQTVEIPIVSIIFRSNLGNRNKETDSFVI